MLPGYTTTTASITCTNDPTSFWLILNFRRRMAGALPIRNCGVAAPLIFPVLGVAAYVKTEKGSDRIADARIVLGGIAPAPMLISEAGQALIGNPLNQDRINNAAEAAYVRARPLDNTDFVMNWRKQMTRQYTLRALQDLQ